MFYFVFSYQDRLQIDDNLQLTSLLQKSEGWLNKQSSIKEKTKQKQCYLHHVHSVI